MRSQYEALGYVVVRSLFDERAVARAREEALALRERHDLISPRNLRCRFQVNAHTGEQQFETFDPIADLSPAARALAEDPGLMRVLADVYGEPAALFKDKLIYKPPGCPGYALHQDWIAWPDFPRSFCTVLAPLDAATRDNGCTIVYPEVHRRGPLSVTDGEYHQLDLDLVDEARAVPLELAPGDVAIFSGFTPHRSATNQSPGWRRQLYLSYNRISDGGDQRTRHYHEFHSWLQRRHAATGKTDFYFE
jgi:ectoine hydroxylase-related dioxygenase (phytanoyl-CoA dioxygenase family)